MCVSDWRLLIDNTGILKACKIVTFFQLQHVYAQQQTLLLRVGSLDLPSIFHLPPLADEEAVALFVLPREVA